MKVVVQSLFTMLFATALTSAHAKSSGGYGHGNGGDICEHRFKTIREDLSNWIVKGGSLDLQLPPELSIEKYNQAMLEKIKSAKVSCIDRKVFIGRAEKTCKNFTNANGSLRIQCNRNRFMTTTESDQYVLVHHEYAGLAGFEVNNGENSNYDISNQISGYLEDQIVKKLAVKPTTSIYKNPFSSASCSGPQMRVPEALDLIPADAKDIEFPTFSIYTLERRCENNSGCSEMTPIETQMPFSDVHRAITFVPIPVTGSIKFVRESQGIKIVFSTPLHDRSGQGIYMICSGMGQGEFDGRCAVMTLPDYQSIGEAYGTISTHCARLTYIWKGYLGMSPVWLERNLLFTATY